jgi:hypothetical protein
MDEHAAAQEEGVVIAGGPAWETGEHGRGIGAWWATCRGVLLDPVAVFRGFRPTGEMWHAFVFYLGTSLVVGMVAFKFSQLTQAVTAPVSAQLFELVEQVYPPEVTELFRRMLERMAAQREWSLLIVGSALFIRSVVYIFGASALVHVCLMVAGASGGGFESTFKAMAYTHGATALLVLIPLCGPILALLWLTCVVVIALVEVHRASTLRVIVGLSLPLIPVFCCAGILMGIVLLGAFQSAAGI